MKTYFIIETPGIEAVDDLIIKVDSILDDNGTYSLCSINSNYKFFIDRIIKGSIKVRFLDMYVSSEILEKLTGKSAVDFKDLDKTTNLTQNEIMFNNIFFRSSRRRFNRTTDIFYNYGLLINKIYKPSLTSDMLKRFIDTLNKELDINRLLLNYVDIRPTLLDFFVKSIKEIHLEERKKSVKATKERNEDFYLNVVAEFIILSSGFYKKDEVKDFIEERLTYKDE